MYDVEAAGLSHIYLDKRDTRDTLTRAIRLCPTRWAARSFAAARISARCAGTSRHALAELDDIMAVLAPRLFDEFGPLLHQVPP